VLCRHGDISALNGQFIEFFGEEMTFPAVTLGSYAERLIVSYLCHAF
jgi:hypothetical protein